MFPLCPAVGWCGKNGQLRSLGQPTSAPEGKGDEWESWNLPSFSPRNKELQGWWSGDPLHHWPETPWEGNCPPIFQRVGTPILNKPTDFWVWCSHFSPVEKSLKLLCVLCSIMGTPSRISFISNWKSNTTQPQLWSWTLCGACTGVQDTQGHET